MTVTSLLPSLGCLSIDSRKAEDVVVADYEYDGFLVVPKVEDIDAPKTGHPAEEEKKEPKKIKTFDEYKKRRYQRNDTNKPKDKTNHIDLLEEKDGKLVVNNTILYKVWERELLSYTTVDLNGTRLPTWNEFYQKPTAMPVDASEYMNYTGFDPMIAKVSKNDGRKFGPGRTVPEGFSPHFLDPTYFQLPSGKTCSEIALNAFNMPGGYGEWINSKVKTFEQEVPMKKMVERKWGMTTKGNSNDKELADAYVPLDEKKKILNARRNAKETLNNDDIDAILKPLQDEVDKGLADARASLDAKKEILNARKDSGGRLNQKDIDAILKPYQAAVDAEEIRFKTHALGMASKWIRLIDDNTGMLPEALRKTEVPFLYQDMGNMNSTCPMPPGWMTFRQAYIPKNPEITWDTPNEETSETNIFNNKYVGPTIKQLKEYRQTGEVPAGGWRVMAAKFVTSAWLMFMGMATSDDSLGVKVDIAKHIRTQLDQGVNRETLDPRHLAQMEATERRRAAETEEETAEALLAFSKATETEEEVEGTKDNTGTDMLGDGTNDDEFPELENGPSKEDATARFLQMLDADE